MIIVMIILAIGFLAKVIVSIIEDIKVIKLSTNKEDLFDNLYKKMQ